MIMKATRLLCTLVLACLLTMGARAADLTIAGTTLTKGKSTTLTSLNNSRILSGSVTYDGDKTVGLTNVIINCTGSIQQYGLYSTISGLRVVVTGTNIIRTQNSRPLYFAASATIDGTGVLTAEVPENAAIDTYAVDVAKNSAESMTMLTIGGAVTMTVGGGGKYGFHANGSNVFLTIGAYANVTVNKCGANALYGFQGLIMGANAKLTLTGNSSTPTVSNLGQTPTLQSDFRITSPTNASYNSSAKTIVQGTSTTGYKGDIVIEKVVLFNETNFPDGNFRVWLQYQGYGKNGWLTTAEIAGVKSMTVKQRSIKSLQGIEFFTALTYLDCSYNDLRGLDVSKNTNLTYLDCIWNDGIKELNVSKNTKLKYLKCTHNGLTELDLSKNTALTELGCRSNDLTTLDLSKNTALTKLDCGWNKLTTLDVTKNTALTELNCMINDLTTLDVTKNTALTELDCAWNKLTTLDVTKNTALTALDCYGNGLTTLDLSKNTKLTKLSCYRNKLTTLNLKTNTELTRVECYVNKITEAGMNTFISNLPTVVPDEEQPSLYEICLYDITDGDEENVFCTSAQVAAAKSKGWTVCYYRNESWPAYPGSDDPSFIVINAKNFPDEAFRNCLLFGGSGLNLYRYGGLVPKEVLADIKELWVSRSGIASLKGIEYFTGLTKLTCLSNQIKGAQMDELISLLPTVTSGELYVINTSNPEEQNVCTTEQVAAAKAKGWTVYDWNDGNTVEYAGSAPSSDAIAIDATNFPDATFRNWLLAQEYGKDGFLTDEEIVGVTEIDVNGLTTGTMIASLKGIELFTALTSLTCYYNALTELDLSDNTALTSLSCEYNQLSSLDVSKNTALTYLGCNGNGLSSLDVSKNTALTYLGCNGNGLTTFDLSKLTKLESLHCENNQLTTLDLQNNPALKILNCARNQLSELDLSNNTALTTLYCYDNQLTALDVSSNPALKEIDCCQNNINGAAMSNLVNSLPTVVEGKGSFTVVSIIEGYEDREHNVCTTAQVAVATAKNWTVKNYIGWGEEYAGSELAKGDANGDGVVDAKDVQAIADYVAGKPVANFDRNAADLAEDGEVDIRDLAFLIRELTSGK